MEIDDIMEAVKKMKAGKLACGFRREPVRGKAAAGHSGRSEIGLCLRGEDGGSPAVRAFGDEIVRKFRHFGWWMSVRVPSRYNPEANGECIRHIRPLRSVR